MLDDFRRKTLIYWEKRRVIYNLLLVPPAWLGWQVSREFTYHIDDRLPASFSEPYVIETVIYLLFMANVCFSMVYFIEILLASEREKRFWPKPGRAVLFVVGCILAMALATKNMSHLQTSSAGPIVNYDDPPSKP
jgi:hypothetical protein